MLELTNKLGKNLLEKGKKKFKQKWFWAKRNASKQKVLESVLARSGSHFLGEGVKKYWLTGGDKPIVSPNEWTHTIWIIIE